MSESKYRTAQIGGVKIEVEIARTTAEKAQGLSDRLSMEPYHGMYFPYIDRRPRNFHMHNMLFSLDMIWLSNGKIVAISENVPLFDDNGVFTRITSPEPADGVLEVNAGFSARNGLKIGDSFKLLTE